MSEHLSTAGARRRLPRTRGAASGLLLVVLGAWGALVAFIGPWFDFAYSPDKSWSWTAARGWLEVLPGAVTFLGGLLLLASSSRITTSLGAWFGIAGGAWFILGPQLAEPFHLGSVGAPTGSSSGLRALEALAYFYALGAVILFLAAVAFGRLSVVTVRDVRVAGRREAARIEAEDAAQRDAAARAAVDRDAAERDAPQRDAPVAPEAAERDAPQRDTPVAPEASEREAPQRDAPQRDAPVAPEASEREAPQREAAGSARPPEQYGRHDPKAVEDQQQPEYRPPANG